MELDRAAFSLVERVVAATGMICVLHAPAGFGKSTFLNRIRARLDRDRIAHLPRLELFESNSVCSWLIVDSDAAQTLDSEVLRRAFDKVRADQAGIVLATRDIGRLPIAKLRAEGSVIILGPKQIAMSRRDSGSTLQTALPRKTADWLSGLANGWSVAVKLLAEYAYVPDARFGEDGEFVVGSGLSDYIDQEILADLPNDWVESLKFASIVDSCNPSMLDGIRPGQDLGRNLAQLRKRLPGLVDDKSGQTVLNPLFQKHLLGMFQQLPAHIRSNALECAARQYLRAGHAPEAASLAAMAGTQRATLDFVGHSEGPRFWVTAGITVIRQIVEAAGEQGIADQPSLKLLQSLVHLKSGEMGEASRILDDVAPDLLSEVNGCRHVKLMRAALFMTGASLPVDLEVDEFMTDWLSEDNDPAFKLMNSSMECSFSIQRGDLNSAEEHILAARAHGKATHNDYELLMVCIQRVNLALARGDIRGARIHLGSVRHGLRDNFPTDIGLMTIIEAIAANLEFESGRLSSARLQARQATQNMPRVEAWLDIYVAAYEPYARIVLLDVGVAGAVAALEAQEAALKAVGLPRIARIVKVIAMCLQGEAALRGCITAPLACLPAIEGTAWLSWHEREFVALAEAYYNLSLDRHIKAAEALTSLIEFAEPRGLVRSVLRAKLLLVASVAESDAKEADAFFEEALLLGARTGMTQVFAEIGGEAVRQRCVKWISEIGDIPPLDPGRRRLYRFFSRWEKSGVSLKPVRLTPRERDVLHALEVGGSDKVIGHRLGVSEHAVHYHLKNIYRKLNVGDRSAALVRSRELHLLN